jgi:flagellar biosynthesis GTPase FlhF
MSKSTPINQLPSSKQPPAQVANDDDDIAIQEVLAEINAQERNSLQQQQLQQPQQQQQMQQHMQHQQQMLMQQQHQQQMQPPHFLQPQPQAQAQSLPQDYYGSSMPLEYLKWQQQQSQPSWTETITHLMHSEIVLFVTVVLVSIVLQQPFVQSWLVKHLHFVNVPYIEIIIQAVAAGVLVVVGKTLVGKYI